MCWALRKVFTEICEQRCWVYKADNVLNALPKSVQAGVKCEMNCDTAPSYSPGLGIGLSLVLRLAELHGGTAWVEDRPGGGASFQVILPGPPH